jgi:SAM-dependent methyltransferase
MPYSRWRNALSERWNDWRLGIHTNAFRPLPGAFQAPERKEYTPISYRHLLPRLGRLPAGPDDVFLDYGCGYGRVVVAAAQRPYRSVIGVELVPEFAAVARENVQGAKGLTCRDVRILQADATAFELPDDVTVLHFFNAFRGAVLDAVVDRIRESLDR